MCFANENQKFAPIYTGTRKLPANPAFLARPTEFRVVLSDAELDVRYSWPRRVACAQDLDDEKLNDGMLTTGVTQYLKSVQQ